MSAINPNLPNNFGTYLKWQKAQELQKHREGERASGPSENSTYRAGERASVPPSEASIHRTGERSAVSNYWDKQKKNSPGVSAAMTSVNAQLNPPNPPHVI